MSKEERDRKKDGFFAAVGYFAAKSTGLLFSGIWKFFRGICRAVGAVLFGTGRATKNAVTRSAENIKSDITYADTIRKRIDRKKYSGSREYANGVATGTEALLFGKRGYIKKFAGFLAPILCIIFLIGVVNYGRTINYAVTVKCNGKVCGTVSDDSVYKEAASIARERINYGRDTKRLKVSGTYMLKAFDRNTSFITAQTLADNIIKASGNEISKAYGIYINNSFVGAVKEKDAVSEALAERLSDFRTVGSDAKDIQYRDAVTFEKGLYLNTSILSDSDMKSKLFAENDEREVYFAQSGDTLQIIAANYNMTSNEIEKLNPGISQTDQIDYGTAVYVIKKQSFLPIEYTREINETEYLNYKTKKIGTLTLPVGTTKILMKGKRGEKQNTVLATYVDGVLEYKKTIKSQILEKPVSETIGVGTFLASPQAGLLPLNGTGQFMWPVNGGSISSRFMEGRVHKGIDIAAAVGTEIYAADNGTVAAAGYNGGGYGYMVLIDHGNGFQTLYAHASALAVQKGEKVFRGQLIALVGATGNATGPHLHFEVRHNGICYNPENFINTENSSALSGANIVTSLPAGKSSANSITETQTTQSLLY